MASAIAFLLKKRYESIVESQKERERRRKAKAQRIPPPPESTEDTAVWFWKLRDVPVTVMLDKESKEIWCNGETLETKKLLPKGTGEQMGLSFTIKVPNLDLLESEDTNDDTTKVQDSEQTEPTEQMEPMEPVQQFEQTKQMGQTELTEQTEQMEPLEPVEQFEQTEHMEETEQTEQSDHPVSFYSHTKQEMAESRAAVTFSGADFARKHPPRLDRAASFDDPGGRRLSAPVVIQKLRRCSQIGRLQEATENSGSNDSLYYDAMDDTTEKPAADMNITIFGNIPEDEIANAEGFNQDFDNTDTLADAELNQSHHHHHPEAYNTPPINHSDGQQSNPDLLNPSLDLSTADGSDDSGYEMAEEAPKFFYHDARIRCFVLDEHRIFELYVDGVMIQEHTKHIQCDNLKNDVAKKMD